MKSILEKLGISKAPWSIGDQPGQFYSVYCDDKTGQRVAKCNGKFLFHSRETMNANSMLIAAAPEILEAMVEFCLRVEKGEVRSKKTYAKFVEIIERATDKKWAEIRGLLDEN